MRIVEHSVYDTTLEHDRILFNSSTPLMFEDIKRFKASITEPALTIQLFDGEIIGIFIFDSFESSITATFMLNQHINQWKASLN